MSLMSHNHKEDPLGNVPQQDAVEISDDENDLNKNPTSMSATMETAITAGIEAALCNIFPHGDPSKLHLQTRRTPRHKKKEDSEVQLEKASEPSQHCDFILVCH